MRNYVKEGGRVTFIAPAGGIVSGQGVLLNALFGVASYSADEGASCEMRTGGVFLLPKAAADTWAQGVKLYFKTSDKTVTTTASGNTLIGYAEQPAVADVTETRVLLAN